MPLAAIREVLAARDPAVTRRVLAEPRERTLAERARLERVLRVTGDLLADPAPVTPARINERTIPPARVFAVTAEVRDHEFAGFLGDAYPRLLAEAGADAAGPPGALYPAEFHDEPMPVTAYVPARRGPAHLPGGRFAVAEFTGSYRSLPEGYRALGAWLASSGLTLAGPVRESYLTGPGDGVAEDEYLTEICWPLHHPREN